MSYFLKSKAKTAAGKIVLLCLLVFLIFGASQAQTNLEELRSDISEKQSELERITTEIQNLQQEILRKQRQAASLRNEIVLFDLHIRQTESQITAARLAIEKLTSKILQTQIAIEEKEAQIAKQKNYLRETLQLIYEYDNISPLELTLGNKTFSELLDQTQYVANLQEQIHEVIEKVKVLKAELQKQKEELETDLVKQEELKQELESAVASLQQQRANKQSLLSRTRGQEKIYQTLLNEAARKQEEVEREIFELEVVVRQRLGDKTLPPIAGLLRWPMSGILTQGYGNTGFHALGYTFHNGIDIGSPAGTAVYASGDGLVYATGRGQAAYGNWVVIKHTLSKDGKVFNIYTLYGHLHNFVVTNGKPIRTGDLVGFEGNTGNTTRLLYGPERGYHLHFTIFDEEGFNIKPGAFQDKYGPYQIPYGYSYNPLNFLQ